MATLIRQHAGFFCNWRTDLPLLLGVNAVIALLLTLIDERTTLIDNLIISNCIGFCIWGSNTLLSWWLGDKLSWPWRMAIAAPPSLLAGFKLGSLFGASDVLAILLHTPEQAWRWVAIAVLVSSCASAFFIVLFHAQKYRAELEAERRVLAEVQQAETAAQLAMLQAQIEPHFLFNTLANLQSLIGSDPAMAQTMLNHLNDYLHASLKRTRQTTTTLAEEIDLVSALLAIQSVRLGDRLQYSLNVPEALRLATLPPLLLQPLVENALEHGIEPAIIGGRIDIDVEQDGEQLRICVSDTGLGLDVSSVTESGIGLANVRARLDKLYGSQAQLVLRPNTPSGVIAELIFPLEMK
ncbi:sensor histidine kinase [Deefgea rivuli]|uniref:sensor histidine kinase n=1 Tax=Deefgea rivuli TaxID=400948 RepID=UPI000B0000A4|nr:histidine kinase [Deefgea rivuli]